MRERERERWNDPLENQTKMICHGISIKPINELSPNTKVFIISEIVESGHHERRLSIASAVNKRISYKNKAVSIPAIRSEEAKTKSMQTLPTRYKVRLLLKPNYSLRLS